MPHRTIPFYAKSTIILFGLILLTITLIFGRDILVPLAFATLLAILLYPVLRLLEKIKLPRLLAILLTVVLALVIVVSVAYFITFQLGQFSEALPMLKVKLLQHFSHLQNWVEKLFGVSTAKQSIYVQQMLAKFLENSGTVLSSTFSVITDVMILITLIPVYVFLLLLYRNLLLYFTIQVFSGNNTVKVSSILHEIKQVIQNYIVGLLIEAAIVASLNSLALMVLGIPYAILLGVLGAILNLVPYVGGIIAIALPILMALVTKEGMFYPVMVVVLYLIIQFIDNNIIVPKVVASKVRINALISILAVLIGGAIWGVSGMFLSIPMVAILKIIFDRVTPLKPWGMLLGDAIPEEPHVQASLAHEHGIIILEKAED